MATDTLLSTTRVAAHDGARAPLIVVGLPRSGSSFLSHVISQIDDWYVFDDLYLQEQAERIGARGPLTDAQLDKLLFFLGWQIRARLRWGKYAIPNVAEDEVEPMNDALRAAFSGSGATWPDLQEEWMTRLAHRAGCRRWGYKMPKAFRSARMLRTHYPGARFLFLMRQPHDVLASYKHMAKGSQDGDPDQYHPLAHALYWRMAAQSYMRLRAELGEDLAFLRFEDLVADPDAAARRIAAFIGAAPPQRVEVPARANTSFAASGARSGVNGLETAIINRICRPGIEALGFARRDDARLRPSDIADFMARSWRFSRYRLRRR